MNEPLTPPIDKAADERADMRSELHAQFHVLRKSFLDKKGVRAIALQMALFMSLIPDDNDCAMAIAKLLKPRLADCPPYSVGWTDCRALLDCLETVIFHEE